MNGFDLVALVLIVAGFLVLGFKKLRLDERRNELLGNLEALQAIKDSIAANAQANRDAANALKDLASKSAGGADISTELTSAAEGLKAQADAQEALVTSLGEPTGTPEAPTA